MAKKKKTAQSAESSAESALEMKARVTELDRDLFSLRNELAVNRKLEKPHLIRAKKREKARLLTRMTLVAKGVA